MCVYPIKFLLKVGLDKKCHVQWIPLGIQRDRGDSPEVMMEVRKIRLHTIMTYGAGISACEKSLEWRRALQLLAELPQNSLEMNLGLRELIKDGLRNPRKLSVYSWERLF